MATDLFEPRLERGRIRIGEEGARVLELTRDGILSFHAPLRILASSEAPRRVVAYGLLQFLQSFTRLTAALLALAAFADEDPVLLDLTIRRARGWSMLVALPGDLMPPPPRDLEDDDLLGDPTPVRWRELRDGPERAAMRLASDVYQAFGFERSWLLRAVDPSTGRLRP